MGKMYFNIKELFTMIVYLKYQLIETVNENKNKKLFNLFLMQIPVVMNI